MTDGMTLDDFTAKYPLNVIRLQEIFARKFFLQLQTEEVVSDREYVFSKQSHKDFMKRVIDKMITSLETEISKIRKDLERIV